jgi:hypothetical protein
MRKIFIKKAVMTLFGLMCAGALTAQWNPQENLRVSPDEILNFEVQTNKDGVSFVAYWKLAQSASGDLDIFYYLQIIDKDGNKVFQNEERRLISDKPTSSSTAGIFHALFIDNDGNALYAVKDQRNASDYHQGFFVAKSFFEVLFFSSTFQVVNVSLSNSAGR